MNINLDYLVIFGGMALFWLLFKDWTIRFAVIVIAGAYALYGSPTTAGLIVGDHAFVAFGVFAVIAVAWFVSDSHMLGKAARHAPTAGGRARATGAFVGNVLVFGVVVLVAYATGKVQGWW